MTFSDGAYYYGGYPLGHAHVSNRGIGLLVVEK